MPNLNKVMLMGNLTRDPEMRMIPSGAVLCEFGLAINRRYKGNDGQQRDETCFVDCTAWGRQAESVKEYLRKGSPAFVEGRLKLDRWQDQNGNNRQKLSVVAERVVFLGRGSRQGQQQQGSATGHQQHQPQHGGGAPASQPPAQQQSGSQQGQAYQPPVQNPGPGLPHDDIPF